MRDSNVYGLVACVVGLPRKAGGPRKSDEFPGMAFEVACSGRGA